MLECFLKISPIYESLRFRFSPDSNHRPYLLITLSHTERRAASKQEVIERMRNEVDCIAIVVSEEQHAEEGQRFHVGVQNTNAKRHSMHRIVRNAFPEFVGGQLNVSPHKGFMTICSYILKEDKSPAIWGAYSHEVIKEMAKASDTHTK